jgi:hypothetical protein
MPPHASSLTPPSITSTTSTLRRTRASRVVVSTVTLSLAAALTLSLAPAAPAAPSPDANPANSASALTKATKKHPAKAGRHRHDHAVLSHAEDSGEVDPAYLSAAAAYAVHGEASLSPSFKASAMASTVDTDFDGLTDDIDPDDDNDGIIDELDPDDNGNGILDVNETTPTTPTDPTDDDDDDDDDVPVTPATIERYGSYQAQVSCNPVTMGGVAKLRSLFMSTYGGRDLGVVRSCGVGGLSEHKEGRAWDWGMNFYNAHEKAQATKALDWLLATVDGEPHARARRVGIMYIIRNRQIWRAYSPSAGWQKYTGPNPHTDHVHFSFTWNGGSGAVSQWTGKVHPTDYGPCPPAKGKMASPWKAPNPYPCGSKPPTTTPVPPTTTVPISTGVDRSAFYKVLAGDTVATVAAKAGLKGWKLRRWNGMPRGGNKTLPAGRWMQVAKVPTGAIVPGFYKVVTGDTLPAVSAKADTKGWRIRRRNGWTKSGLVTLLPGQWLQVRKVTTVNVRR